MSLLLRDARLVPLDGTATGGPVDVRVDGDRVDAVGRGLEPRAWDDVVDLGGRYVVPGLWDHHVHMAQWAMARERLDVSAARSPEEAAALVVARLRERPVAEDGLLVGVGFRDGLWPRSPVAADLDDAIAAAGLPPTAVVVMSGDVHSGWFSTRALERFGVRSPDGILREDDWFAVVPALQDLPTDVQDDGVATAARAAAERGVVGVVDLEFTDNLQAWHRRVAGGLRTLRVEAGVWEEHLDGLLGHELATGDVVPGTDGLVRVGSLKVISDGSLGTRTAFCHDPYTGVGEPTHGAMNIDPDRLVTLMAHAHRHGVRSAIHAIGDRATAVALDAFAASGAQGSIEHAQMVTADDVPRFAELGVVASVQPEHLMDDRDLVERYWAGREDRVFPLRRLHAAGVRLAFGSDAPVAPLDPWAAIASAVDRTVPGREPWRPEEALPAWVALAASVRSRVEVGAVADLAVLDADPLAARGAALRGMPVVGTLLAGEWTHRAF